MADRNRMCPRFFLAKSGYFDWQLGFCVDNSQGKNQKTISEDQMSITNVDGPYKSGLDSKWLVMTAKMMNISQIPGLCCFCIKPKGVLQSYLSFESISIQKETGMFIEFPHNTNRDGFKANLSQ